MRLSEKRRHRTTPFAGAIVLFSFAGAAPALAQSDWEYTGFVYLWGAGIGGETVTGQDIDVSFSDILDNLDFGLMGTLEARNGPWAIIGDAIYLSISDDEDACSSSGTGSLAIAEELSRSKVLADCARLFCRSDRNADHRLVCFAAGRLRKSC